jgi:hypothetical protein
MTVRYFNIQNREVQKEIAEKIATALDNPVSMTELRLCCADHIPSDRAVIHLRQRRPGWVHPPSQEVVVGDGHRISIAFEDRGNYGICRHVAITLDDANYGDNVDPRILPQIAEAFRIDPSRMVSSWFDEYEPGKWRLNYLTREFQRSD